MENLESNGQPSSSSAAIITKIDVTAVGDGANKISNISECSMMESNIESGTATPVVHITGEEKIAGGNGELQEEEANVERKVENTPKKANKRKRIKSKTPSDAGATISRSEKIDSGGDKKGENDDEQNKIGNNLKKAIGRRKNKLKRVTLAGAGNAASAVSGGEEKLVLEEEGESTPKKSNRLEGEKRAQLASVDAVTVISKGEEGVGEVKGTVENIRKKAKRRRSVGGKRGKNTTSGDASDAVAKDADKPETSGARKDSKRAKSMGMIFMCNSTTKPDCFQYKVFGLPASKKDMVVKIYEGMRLFLYDTDLKLLYGIYKAAGPGGYNIEHKAFKSAFPSQVRFTILDDCVPLTEETFKAAIKDNYYTKNKFSCELTAEQVKNLCKLFLKTNKGSKRKQGGNDYKGKVRSPVGSKRKRGGSDYREVRSPAGSKRKRVGSGYEREVRSPVGSKRERGRSDYKREVRSAATSKHVRGGNDYKREVRSAVSSKRARGGSDYKREVRRPAPTRQIHVYERESFVPQPPPPPRRTLQWPSYERESYASTAVPPRPPPQSYVYEQPAQTGYYRRDPQPDLHDPHYLTHSELRQQSETRYREFNVLYQEPVSYRDPLDPSHLPPGYYPPSYRY